ncbi:hypothetical protein ACFSTA_19075 [Ornithinibacillus salinisoli]|uniref:DUF4825 domain-containing protein n=1 Tax=Ornithinibacillus salinisoli TaxID=1848459 RepID=A0ABW4W3W9_9BACI
MKKKIIGLLVATTIVIVITLAFNKLYIHKKFEQVVKQINEETLIEGIAVSTHFDNEIDMKTKYRIEDKEIVSSILNGFTHMELKRTKVNMNNLDYGMQVTTTNMDAGKRTQSFNLTFNDNYLTIVDFSGVRSYKIVNESEHLKVIESLRKNEDIDWVKF